MSYQEFNTNDIPDEVFETIRQHIDWYSTGLIRVRQNKFSEEVALIGSGTFVTVGDIHGILTAQHVAARLSNVLDLGLTLSPEEHKYVLKRGTLSIIEVAKGSQDSEGPDLALIVIPGNELEAIKAKKSFYPISLKREKALGSSLPFDMGIWAICGYPDEHTTEEPSRLGFDSVTGFHGICGFALLGKAFEKDNFDYLDFEVSCAKEKSLPSSYGGVSGGGVWQLELKLKDGKLAPQDPILSGVAFYQSAIQSDKRTIRCHGRQSLYKVAHDQILAHSS
jgi:hypothetical protein